MLYVYYGTEAHTVADRANAAVAGIKKKQPDAQVFVFEGAFVDGAPLDELIEARGLFVEKHVVVLKEPFETEVSRDLFIERLERIAQSNNIFILAEGKLDAAHKKKLEKHAERMEEHTRAAKEKDTAIFALGDALGARDRRTLWKEYVCALRRGTEPEALHGTLAWAARCLVLASQCRSAEEAGLNPFVYNKFKRYTTNYTAEERHAMSQDLVDMYHNAHRGKHDLAIVTERWTLSV